MCLHCFVQLIVYKQFLVALQVPRRSHNSCTAMGIALSRPNISFPEGGTAMDLTACRTMGPHMSPRWQLPTFCPAPRGHHRVAWEILLVKVSGQFYPKLSNREGPTEVAGKAWHPLPWTSHPTMVIPHTFLCVDRPNQQRQGDG